MFVICLQRQTLYSLPYHILLATDKHQRSSHPATEQSHTMGSLLQLVPIVWDVAESKIKLETESKSIGDIRGQK